MKALYRHWWYQTVSNWASTDSGRTVNSSKSRLWGSVLPKRTSEKWCGHQAVLPAVPLRRYSFKPLPAISLLRMALAMCLFWQARGRLPATECLCGSLARALLCLLKGLVHAVRCSEHLPCPTGLLCGINGLQFWKAGVPCIPISAFYNVWICICRFYVGSIQCSWFKYIYYMMWCVESKWGTYRCKQISREVRKPHQFENLLIINNVFKLSSSARLFHSWLLVVFFYHYYFI